MKKTLLACLLGTTLIATAQSGYTPAIVIDNKGDSLFGEIDYKDWHLNPADIDFMTHNKEKMNFVPGSIQSFFIIKTAERYISYNVDIDMNPRDYNQVIAARIVNTLSEKRSVFLLQVVRNNSLSLYLFTDNNKDHFFYSVENSQPVALIDRYLYIDEEGGQVQHIASYISQLETLMGSCPEVARKAKEVPYLENKLKNIVVKYLRCADPKYVAEVKADNNRPIKFGLVLGAMYNTFKFEGSNALATGDFKSNLAPVIGLSVDVGLPRRFNSWHVVNELIYKNYKTNSTFNTHTFLYDYTTKADFSFSYIQVNTVVRYVIHSYSSLNAFVNVGMGNGYLLYRPKNSVRTSYENGDLKSDKPMDLQKYERSWLIGAGITVKRVLIEARYASGNGFSPYTQLALKSTVSSPQLILTYQF